MGHFVANSTFWYKVLKHRKHEIEFGLVNRGTEIKTKQNRQILSNQIILLK